MNDGLTINNEIVESKSWSLSGLFEAIKLAQYDRLLRYRASLLRGFGARELENIGEPHLRPGYRNLRCYRRIELSSKRRHAAKKRSAIQFRRWPDIDGRSTRVIEIETQMTHSKALKPSTELIYPSWRERTAPKPKSKAMQLRRQS